jgi:hypothetical protein
VIIAVCADKDTEHGSPGVSTLALALAATFPLPSLVLEADPSGGDLAFRLQRSGGGPLWPEPTLLSLAADVRHRLTADALPSYAQSSSAGASVIIGPSTGEAYLPVARFWPEIAAAARAWPGVVVADLGRLSPHHDTAAPLLSNATAVVLVTRADLAGLYRLRERVHDLAAGLADSRYESSRLGIVVRCAARRSAQDAGQITELLHAIGSPARVLGTVVDDAAGAHALTIGRPRRRGLLSSARTLVDELVRTHPVLAAGPAMPPRFARDAAGRGVVTGEFK